MRKWVRETARVFLGSAQLAPLPCAFAPSPAFASSPFTSSCAVSVDIPSAVEFSRFPLRYDEQGRDPDRDEHEPASTGGAVPSRAQLRRPRA